MKKYRLLFKPLLDKVVSILILSLLLPVLFVLSIMVLFKLGRPIFFRQARPGLNGRIFYMSKFRSMTDSIDEKGRLRSDNERLTTFGMKLRATSLDELPSLVSVLKGDMSLVGPRPLLVEYLPLYTNEQKRRHNVLPGITGWAQVNGRNAISWEEKFKLDVWYVENQSFWLDIKILLMTVKKVFVRDGISAEGHVTIEPFSGSKDD